MANKYFSSDRNILCPNVYYGNINPPVDFQFQISIQTAEERLFWWSNKFYNEDTNTILKRIMVWSNFADGLVFKHDTPNAFTPCFNVNLTMYAFSAASNITGTLTFEGGEQAVTGAGTSFLADISPNDYIYDGQNYVYKVSDVTDDTHLNTYERHPFHYATTGPLPAKLLSQIGFAVHPSPVQVDMLNTWFDCNYFFNPAEFSGAAAGYLAMGCTLYGPDNGIPATKPLTFMTHSISTDFADESCYFSIQADIEHTLRGF